MAEKSIGEVYEDRHAVAFALQAAIVEGYAEVLDDPTELVGWYEHDEWAVIYCFLPNGTDRLASWHLRPEDVPDWLGEPDDPSEVFDGHTRDEKNERLYEYARGVFEA